MNFENNQVDTDNIPRSENVQFLRLDPAFRKLSIMTTSVFFIGILIIYFVVGIFVDELYESPWIFYLIGFWPLLTGFFIWLTFKGYEFEGYAVRRHDIIYKSGLIFRSVIVIPFNRVQHCEVNQGPLDRWMGLAVLSVFTAGGSSSDLSIPGLKPDTANTIRDFIIGKTAVDEEE
ncbi:MAG: PH domain-containing protein [Saprospiraceae bacterium]|nr:PH domain-containing protein [Saprospiraceae bacterium]